MARDIVHELRGFAIGKPPGSLVRQTTTDAADEIERLSEVVGNLCLSIAHAAEDIKDGDAAKALAILNAALKSQGCETV